MSQPISGLYNKFMRRILIKILLLLFLGTTTYSNSLTNFEADTFINALLANSEELEKYFDSSEVILSQRLGISYRDVKFKPLISNDIDSQIKAEILERKLAYEYEIFSLETDFSKLVVNIPKKNVKYEFIFHNSKFISKPNYYSRNWKTFGSKYFIFHTADPSLLNEYSIKRLDSFVENMLKLLECSSEDIQKLENEKIHYFLCRDDSEINNLTGYSARGLYYLANDYIISTFNCHYHEISHLLLNYKLKSLNLFTLPLLQEGFAVAYGGRGGKEPWVILDMGFFLANSDFLDYKMLLSKSAFYQFDVSMTYPISGLYVKFLIEYMGIDQYLQLYNKYSSTSSEFNNLDIDLDDLPSDAEWKNYLKKCENSNSIKIPSINESNYSVSVTETENISIYSNENEYLIKLKNSIGLRSKEVIKDYKSQLFSELFPATKYQNEKYIILVSSDEVSIYNLFTNNLIAKYVKGFSINNESVNQNDGCFVFSVKKEIFDESLKFVELVKIGT